MSLHLVEPGERVKRVNGKDYPNRFYLVRGEVAGQEIEVSTKTVDKPTAELFKAKLEVELLSGRVPDTEADVTFAEAARFYQKFRNPADTHRRAIDKLLETPLAKMNVRLIKHADLVAIAKLNPGHSAATMNRMVMRPAATVLHYAATNSWCEWLRVTLFKEKKPTTRAVSKGDAALLIANAPGAEERLLLLWLFKMGTRISDTLRVENGRINRERRTVEVYISKINDWREFPIDDELWEELDKFTPEGENRLFRWRSRSGVYKWLRRLCKRLGIYVTPHMGRHSMATWLTDAGADIKTLMAAGGWDDVKSVARYIKTDEQRVRTAKSRVGKLMGKTTVEPRKARK